MAKSDANEQVKEILRQLIKHRFWIAIGFASLFAVVAYFMGSGPVKAKATAEITKIKQAAEGVKAYQTTTKPTDAYKPIVAEKTEIMGKDVNKAWKGLYERQAPLLTWPEVVKDRIAKWGRAWPKEHDTGKVQLAIVDYIEAYPPYVDMVYKTFDPFDYETGKGVVAAPAKEALLRPAQFSIDGSKLPTLGKIWAAQERLWIQRTMLEVVRQVNKQAKDWDSAIIKEITALEVGNLEAQDQRSLAKGEAPAKAPDILSPEQEAAAAASGADAAGAGGAGAPGTPMAGGGMREMMMGQMRGMMGGSGGIGQVSEEGIYYITPANDKGQYKILPVLITVFIDQDHVQDLLVELENSPMSIQVKDFELERPATQVAKPEKGVQPAGMGMMGMMGSGGMMPGMRGMMPGMRGMMMSGRGYGGMAAQMEQQMGRMGMMPGGMGMPGMGMMPGMGPMGGGREARKGVDIRGKNLKEERKQKLEEIEKQKGPTLFDPYFNIVQVTVYGQARFYNPPPADAESQPSLGDVAASPAAPGTSSGNAPAAAAPSSETEKPAAPAPAEKGAPPAPGADAKSAEAEPGAGNAAGNPAADKPADAKPAGPGTDSAQPDNRGAAPKK
jgi:hypothetical protein